MRGERTPRRFPVLDEAIKSRGTVRRFVEQSGIGEQTYYKMQDGTNDPTYYTVVKCLQYTGLTFEQAFQEKE
ncbi:MAG: hypothetical protein J6S60_00580 [Oscillospiraceae bacterium]|nr:hypothetical protein [Oscillospiraceae bacterium]